MNDTLVASRHDALRSDHGFTMVEVLVAIVILGIVTTAATFFSIQALQTTETQQRRQVAVAVATEAMEAVSASVATVDAGTTVSYLLGGREKTAVEAAWAANSTVAGVSQTYAGYDPKATTTSGPHIKLIDSVEQNGTTYSVTTLIGWCFQEKTTSKNCSKIPGYMDTPPATPASNWANRLLRVITIVRWSAGAQCADVPCQVQTTTLVDGSGDLEWKTS